MKEIKEDLNKWRDITCLWIERFDMVKILIFPNLVYSFNVIPIKTPAGFHIGIPKVILKCIYRNNRIE